MAKDSLLKRILREVRLVYLLRDAWHSLMGRNMNGVLLTDMSGSYPDILKFKEMADQHHLSYAVVLLPSLNETFKTLPLKLDEDRIIFMDLSSLKNEFTPLQFMASKFDGHPSAMVHRRIGGLLSEYIMGTVFQLASERAD